MALNGPAIAIASVGGLMLYAAVKGTGISDTARYLLSGNTVPTATPAQTVSAAVTQGASGDTALKGLLGNPLSNNDPTLVGGNTAAQALQWALGQVGKPYRWGATGPDAFDCSGLVYAAYRAVGVKIPRLTTGSFLVSPKFVSVPRDWSKIQTGDLIFPDPGHVVFCIDPTSHQILEAPHTGANVRVMNYSEFSGIFAVRRYRGY